MPRIAALEPFHVVEQERGAAALRQLPVARSRSIRLIVLSPAPAARSWFRPAVGVKRVRHRRLLPRLPPSRGWPRPETTPVSGMCAGTFSAEHPRPRRPSLTSGWQVVEAPTACWGHTASHAPTSPSPQRRAGAHGHRDLERSPGGQGLAGGRMGCVGGQRHNGIRRSGGWNGSVGPKHVPAGHEISDPAGPHTHPFCPKQLALELQVAAVAAQCAARAHHAVAGCRRVVALTQHRAGCPPCARTAGRSGDVAVSGHAARRNPPDHGEHPPGEIRGRLSHGSRGYRTVSGSRSMPSGSIDWTMARG